MGKQIIQKMDGITNIDEPIGDIMGTESTIGTENISLPPHKSYMIMDMQYGSTGKGLLAGYLAMKNKPDTVVTAWGPNAGHTYISPSGRKFVHRMLANGVVSPNLRYVLIGPGSVIDPVVLLDECLQCADLLQKAEIIIHPAAAIVTKEHVAEEASNVKIGSTMKGTGAAVIQRIKRDPHNSNIALDAFPQTVLDTMNSNGIRMCVSDIRYMQAVLSSDTMQIEGAQGFSLSIYHGFYPYCTSRDVTPSQVLADCAIPYHIRPEVYGTLRTFPIRVANRFDESGNKIGSSGPCYHDQDELSWSDIGVAPELTTVTKLPRRVFSFSYSQLTDAVNMLAPSQVFLNFVNYMPDVTSAMIMIENIAALCNVAWIGTGPAHANVMDISDMTSEQVRALLMSNGNMRGLT